MKRGLVTKSCFHEALQADSRTYSMPCTTRYVPATDETYWLLGDQVFGVSAGPLGTSDKYWLVLEETA